MVNTVVEGAKKLPLCTQIFDAVLSKLPFQENLKRAHHQTVHSGLGLTAAISFLITSRLVER